MSASNRLHARLRRSAQQSKLNRSASSRNYAAPFGNLRRALALASSILAVAAAVAACSSDDEAAGVQTAPGNTTSTALENSSTALTATGPRVKEGGTPRIGEICPNLEGQVRTSANGQDLRCATVGGTEIWTVVQQASSAGTPDRLWVPIVPSTPAPEPQDPAATDVDTSGVESSESPATTPPADPGAPGEPGEQAGTGESVTSAEQTEPTAPARPGPNPTHAPTTEHSMAGVVAPVGGSRWGN